MNYNLKAEWEKALQNITGKTIATKATLGEVLHAFNNQYVCVVTFAKTPSTAAVVLKKGTATIAAEEDGTYALKEGTYSYTASAAGYFPKTTTALTLTNADETTGTKEVELTLTKYAVVTFTKVPTSATIVLKSGANTVAPEANGTYNLAAGSYTYTASADGYVTKTDEALTVAAGDVTAGTKAVNVTLVKYCVVTFTKTPADLTLVVKSGANTVTANANGTYNLIEGNYTYTATKEGYTTITDEALAISSAEVTTGTKTVTVTMTASGG